MSARLAGLPKAAQIALVAGLLLLVLLMGYFILISPKRSEAASLKQQVATVQSQINANRSSGFQQALPAVRSASVFSLTQAMPNNLDTPDVILELNSLARQSGISFDSITPGEASTAATTTTVDPFAAEPIQATFTGSYYDLLAFLQRVRNLVRVQNGKLFTAGRLFDVSSVQLAEGTKGWPQVSATLTINEFVPQAVATTAPTTSGTSTTSTTSTTTTATTTTPSSSTSAAPSTSGGNS